MTRSLATETITSTAENDRPDSHMFQLLRKGELLTNRYRTQGKRHHHLMQLKHHCRVIREYQLTLQSENWHNFCQELGHETGLSLLWRNFRGMKSRAKTRLPILDEMRLQMDYRQVEDALIHAFFAHAVDDPSPFLALPVVDIDR